jgi:hypothetical protein
MKTRSLLTGLALAAAVTVGGVTAAGAQTEPTPGPEAKEARAAFVCANQDRITDLLSRRADLLEDRLALAQDARAAAEEAGATKLVERIDRRIERIGEAQARVETRTGKFTPWVGENCAG